MYTVLKKSNWNLMKEVSQFIVLLTMILSITRAYTMLIARKRSTVIKKHFKKS